MHPYRKGRLKKLSALSNFVSIFVLQKIKRMAHVAGVKLLKNAKGVPVKLVIDINKHYGFVEDFLDKLDIELRKKDDKISFSEATSILDKKHGIKRK